MEGLYPAYPGSIASASRFVRMSILVDQVCTFAPSPWPSDTNWSPGFAGAEVRVGGRCAGPAEQKQHRCTLQAALFHDGVQDFPGRTALAQADGIIRTVDIVRGLQPEFLGWTQVRLCGTGSGVHGARVWRMGP